MPMICLAQIPYRLIRALIDLVLVTPYFLLRGNTKDAKTSAARSVKNFLKIPYFIAMLIIDTIRALLTLTIRIGATIGSAFKAAKKQMRNKLFPRKTSDYSAPCANNP